MITSGSLSKIGSYMPWRPSTLFMMLLGFVVTMCAGGCKELRFDTTYNHLYYDACIAMEEDAITGRDKDRLITAYTSLLYMDAEVAGSAGKAFQYSKAVRMTAPPGVDKSVAAQALLRIASIYGSEKNWDKMLDVLTMHREYLVMRGDVLTATTMWLERAAEQDKYRGQVASIAKHLITDSDSSPYSDVLEARTTVYSRLVRLADTGAPK